MRTIVKSIIKIVESVDEFNDDLKTASTQLDVGQIADTDWLQHQKKLDNLSYKYKDPDSLASYLGVKQRESWHAPSPDTLTWDELFQRTHDVRKALAQNPQTPEHVLDGLSASNTGYNAINQAVASNPGTNHQTLTGLFRTYPEEVFGNKQAWENASLFEDPGLSLNSGNESHPLIQLANERMASNSSDPEFLHFLAGSKNPRVTQELAKNSNIVPATMHRLIDNDPRNINYKYVASNANINEYPDVIDKIRSKPNGDHHLALNHYLSSDLLHDIATKDDINLATLLSLATHHNLSHNSIKHLLSTDNPNVRDNLKYDVRINSWASSPGHLATHANADEEITHTALDRYPQIAKQVLSSTPHLSAQAKAFNTMADNDENPDSWREAIQALSVNKKKHPGFIDVILDHMDELHHNNGSFHESFINTTPLNSEQALKAAQYLNSRQATDADPKFRSMSTNDDIKRAISALINKSPTGKKDLISKGARSKINNVFSTNDIPHIRRDIANHPNTSLVTLKRLATKDPDGWVRHLAKTRLSEKTGKYDY